jgi:hypothetical protein
VDHEGPRKFTTVAPLVSVEGRIDDAVVRPDGAIVTAGALDRALEPISAIELWQANQRRADLLELDFVAESDVTAAVKASLAPLLQGVEIVPRAVTAIAAEPSGKYRVAKRHFSLDLAHAFERLQTSPS